MFLPFFENLRDSGVPVSLREYLGFLEGVRAGLVTYDTEAFYYLARTIMVKDERNIDKFDRAFATSFAGLESISADQVLDAVDLPQDWLEKLAEKHLSAEEKAEIAALGGFEKLMETLRERLKEQKGRHQGGSKWVGTAGTSPFGAYGYNPEGVRIGQDESRHQRAVKVWDKREFRNLDDTVELGTRNIKVALKRLRSWARDGAHDELDLDGTIRATAEHGYLDVQTRPERRNAVKVLLFWTWAGRWIPISAWSKNYSAPHGLNSSTLNTSIFTIAFTRGSGATTAAVGAPRSPHRRCCAPMALIINAYLWVTPVCRPTRSPIAAARTNTGTTRRGRSGWSAPAISGHSICGSTPCPNAIGPIPNPLP